jgi:pyrimidine-nucleoside phosphorylase
MAMVESGETVDLSGIPGFKADKHSTGGVGDKTTLVVAPLAAACGVKIAKMSGRSLGHTGGTLDKLESIPGFNVDLSRAAFIQQVKEIGVAITGQTADLVPADKKIYALRDRTGTVASLPLIAASVMSKKIAAGAEYIVLDIKAGNGAFMADTVAARRLADICVRLGRDSGRAVTALITDMDQPLGFAIGNALEVKEAIAVLGNRGPADVTELSLAIVALMVARAGLAHSVTRARRLVADALAAGAGLRKFGELIEAQGGDASVIHEPERLLIAPGRAEALAAAGGYVTEFATAAIGRLAKETGGLLLKAKIGDQVSAGDVLAYVFAADAAAAAAIADRLTGLISIGPRHPRRRPLVLDRAGTAP